MQTLSGTHNGKDTAATLRRETFALDDGSLGPDDDETFAFMWVGDDLAPTDKGLALSPFNYFDYSEIAGPITEPPEGKPYRVQYRGINRTKREWLATRLIVLVLVALDVRFMSWLVLTPGHFSGLESVFHAAMAATTASHKLYLLGTLAVHGAMVAGSIIMQLFLLMNVLTVSRACIAARDPIPVMPEAGKPIAFVTTLVPGKEPIAMAARTLRAAKNIVYAGRLDVWLLDEGHSPAVQAMCKRLGVQYYSRKNWGYLPQKDGKFAKQKKHGNHNTWFHEVGGQYDYVLINDTDHVPLPSMARRMLGYFRDPDIAFVVGPQFYGNPENPVARRAESAQYLFHGVIQRGGNARECAMLVGTCTAVRVSAILEIDGYVDSITEDMATSMLLHATRNPKTGRKYRSVYTPDLVAVGLGPTSWSEWFGQQTRWSAGTYDAVKHQFWKVARKLRPGALLHYFLMLTYYPSVAIGWVMGIAISACYLGFGITGLRTNSGWWLTYYVDIAAMQYVLYLFMRRHNVSPHEPKGSSGFSGMLMSALTVPIYARSCLLVWVMGRVPPFVVTSKGESTDPDRLWTFRYSLMWAVVPIIILAAAVYFQRNYALMMAWSAIILVICVAPVAIWRFDKIAGRLTKRRHARRHGQHRLTEESEKVLTSSR